MFGKQLHRIVSTFPGYHKVLIASALCKAPCEALLAHLPLLSHFIPETIILEPPLAFKTALPRHQVPGLSIRRLPLARHLDHASSFMRTALRQVSAGSDQEVFFLLGKVRGRSREVLREFVETRPVRDRRRLVVLCPSNELRMDPQALGFHYFDTGFLKHEMTYVEKERSLRDCTRVAEALREIDAGNDISQFLKDGVGVPIRSNSFVGNGIKPKTPRPRVSDVY